LRPTVSRLPRDVNNVWPARPPDRLLARLCAARRARGLIAIFDLDGTLARIAATPSRARVPAHTRRALARLAARADTTVGIVSGRPLAAVARLVGVRGLWVVGLHGYARRAPGGRTQRLWTRAAERQARALAARLRRALAGVRGARVELKGPLVAVHVRAAEPAGRRAARRIVARLRPPGHLLLEGRRVLELGPADRPTKADAVRWIAAGRPGSAILYVGDDTTDEQAFQALGPEDFPVRVVHRERPSGSGRSRARYRLADPAAVAALIAALAASP
jgi:trehalose 6-phosphate phosphatase